VEPLTVAPNGDVCAICLGPFESMSMADACFHRFCFVCLLQWCNITPSCPLCKARVRYILYDLTADYQYRRFDLQELSRCGTLGSRSVEKFPTEAHRRRRTVYTRGLRASIPTSTRKTVPLTPRTFSESLWDKKIGPWVKRELQALLKDEDPSLILLLVKNLLQKLEPNSKEFKDRIREFLENDTDTFVHELLTFASSPYDMYTYDRLVSYEPPTPPSSSSSSPSSPISKLRTEIAQLDEQILAKKRKLEEISKEIEAETRKLSALSTVKPKK
jgi:E3 ubiquitin-protein ligase Topors